MHDENHKLDAHLESDRRSELAKAIESGDRAKAEHIASILGEKAPTGAKLEDRKAKQAPVEKRGKK